MNKASRYRIYPNEGQKKLLIQTFGNCRFVYNYYLAKRIEIYKKEKKTFNYYQCSNDLTNLKKKYEWLKISDKYALQNTLRDLDKAYRNFFNNRGYFRYPKFKSKRTYRYLYRTCNYKNNIRVENKHIKLPKLEWIKIQDKRIPRGRIINVTIVQESSGRYYCCR